MSEYIPYTATIGDPILEEKQVVENRSVFVDVLDHRYGPEYINCNDTIAQSLPTHPTVFSEVIQQPLPPISAAGTTTVDVDRFTSADLKQLRKNIKKLQTMEMCGKLRQVSHFDIGQLFSVNAKSINK